MSEESSPSRTKETLLFASAEIDARHARHLLERALSQLERGDRPGAILLCRQAMHLAPHSCHAYSLAGFLSLLDNDLLAATRAYEKVIESGCDEFAEHECLTAVERLRVLRRAQKRQAPLDVAGLVANLPREIVRLRRAIAAAPLSAFLSSTKPPLISNAAAATAIDARVGTPPVATPTLPSQAQLAPSAAAQAALAEATAERQKTLRELARADEPEHSSEFIARLQRRRRISLAITIACALLAATLSAFAVHSWRLANEEPAVANSTVPTGNVTTTDSPVAVLPAAPDATANNANGTSPVPASTPPPTTSTAPAPTPTPTPKPPMATAPVRAVTPTRPAATTPRTSSPAPRVVPTPRPVVRPTPRPTPAPEPQFPAMPRPRVTLPGAGHAAPEFPRVLPPPADDYETPG